MRDKIRDCVCGIHDDAVNECELDPLPMTLSTRELRSLGGILCYVMLIHARVVSLTVMDDQVGWKME